MSVDTVRAILIKNGGGREEKLVRIREDDGRWLVETGRQTNKNPLIWMGAHNRGVNNGGSIEDRKSSPNGEDNAASGIESS